MIRFRPVAVLVCIGLVLSGVLAASVHAQPAYTWDVRVPALSGTLNTQSLRGLALSPDDATLYAGYINNTHRVRRYQTSDGVFTGDEDSFTGTRFPKAIATSAAGYVYVAQADAGVVDIYTATLGAPLASLAIPNRVAAPRPEGVGVTGTVLYVGDRSQGGLFRYDIAAPTAPTLDTSWGSSGFYTLTTSAGKVRGVEVAPDDRIWVAANGEDTVYVVAADASISTTIGITTPHDVAFFGSHAYVSTEDHGTIERYDAATLAHVDIIRPPALLPGGGIVSLEGLDIDAQGTLYVADALPRDRVLAAQVRLLTLLTVGNDGRPSDMIRWADQSSGPVYDPPSGGRAYYPTVIYDAARFGGHGLVAAYKTWYTWGGSLGLATSEDGITWTEVYTSLASLTNPHHARVLYDAGGFGGSGVYYKMWYWDTSKLYDPDLSIRYAESADGITWSNDQGVFGGDDTYPWQRGSYGPVDVLYDAAGTNTPGDPMSHKYVMYYDGTTGAFEQVGLAYSADGISWTRYSLDTPVLPSGRDPSEGWGLPTPWDSSYVGFGTVLKDVGGTYHFWYSGGTTDMNHGIGYAWSSDGLNWTKSPANPILHKDDGVSWRSSRTYTPAVQHSATRFDGQGDGVQYKMWYSAKDDSNYTVGYALLNEDVFATTPFTLTTTLTGTGLAAGYPRYRLNAGGWIAYTAPFTLPGTAVTYTLEFHSQDTAGNGEGVRTFQPGSLRVHNLDTDEWFPTIQSAIDDPGTLTGHTLWAANGVYTESVTISKGITLTGETRDGVIVDGDGASNTILVAANDVTIQQLTACHASDDIIRQSGSYTGTVVRYTTIHNSSGDDGVQLKNCTGCLIEHSLAYDVAQDGFNFADSTDCVIRYNEVYDSRSENGAIFVYGSGPITVEHNYIHDTTANNGIKVYKMDAGVIALCNNRIENNNFQVRKNNEVAGILLRPPYDTMPPGGSQFLIQENRVINNTCATDPNLGNGLYWQHKYVDGAPVTISNNQFVGNTGHGIVLEVQAGVTATFTATHNLIRGNGADGFYAFGAGNMVNQVAGNIICGNGDYGTENLMAGSLDARHNWWGHNPPVSAGLDYTGTVDVTAPISMALSHAPDPGNAGDPVQVTATFADDGYTVPDGTEIAWAASRDSVSPPTSTTTSGVATTTLNTSTVDTVVVSASVACDYVLTTTVTIQPGDPHTLTLDGPAPAAVCVNGGTAVVTATVTDEFANPIPNAPVTFTTDLDATMVPGTANTDAAGVATSTFQAGALSGVATITATAGAPATDAAAITVNPAPVAAFTADPGTTLCAGEMVAFTNASTGAATYEWDFGDGSPGATTTDVTHVYATDGVYTVVLTATSGLGCGFDVTSAVVTVNPLPTASFTTSANPTATLNVPVFFTYTASGAVAWQWNFGDGGTSTLENPTHTYTALGPVTVTLTVTNAHGCVDEHSVPLIVVPSEAPQMMHLYLPLICKNHTDPWWPPR